MSPKKLIVFDNLRKEVGINTENHTTFKNVAYKSLNRKACINWKHTEKLQHHSECEKRMDRDMINTK